MEFYPNYYPITATPFQHNKEYMELAPCAELAPYVRCFWGMEAPIKQKRTGTLTMGSVIPDTCVDVMFFVNYTKNEIFSSFCGIDDVVFYTNSWNDTEDEISNFCVRFYAWSAILFSEESMKDTKNGHFDAGLHFEPFKRHMENLLFEKHTLKERSLAAQEYLLKHFHAKKENSLFVRAMNAIMEQQGNLKTLELAKELHISSRQMERVFYQNMGVTPKKAASLIRYQCLWQEACFNPQFQIMDAVHKYGYADQAHLLHEFKKIHGMSLTEARRYAFQNVDFLQENK